MIQCSIFLRECANKFDKLRSEMQVYTANSEVEKLVTPNSFKSFKSKFTTIYYDTILNASECYNLFSKNYFKDLLDYSKSIVKDFIAADSIEKIISCIDRIVERITEVTKVYYYDDEMNSTAIRYLNGNNNNKENDIVVQLEANHYALSQNDLDKIFKIIDAPKNRIVNMFIPDCGMGANFKYIPENYHVYANEESSDNYKQVKNKFYKVIRGKISMCRIKNNAFDVLYLQPPVAIRHDKTLLLKGRRSENYYIANMLRYLRDNGIAIIVMPYTRLFIDNCKMLSKYLKDIQVFRNPESNDYKNIGLVYIIGRKKKEKFDDIEARNYLRKCCIPESYIKNIKDIQLDNTIKKYNIFNNPINIDLFRSEILDTNDIKEIFENSKLNQNVIDEQFTSSKSTKKEPLLPFNLGQLGLILTSGCLDGIVEDVKGGSHLVKGRVEKRILKRTEQNSKGENIVINTYLNRVEINVLLPNGDFKTII